MVTTSPTLTSIEFCSGSKRQGSPPATLASKRTLSLRSRTREGAAVATWVVPPKPVERHGGIGCTHHRCDKHSARGRDHDIAASLRGDVPSVHGNYSGRFNTAGPFTRVTT